MIANKCVKKLNLQEQVIENAKDIEYLLKYSDIKQEYGILIVKEVEVLPEVTSEEFICLQPGLAYAVIDEGEAPDIYVKGLVEGETKFEYGWIELGKIKGAKGDQGEVGPEGPEGPEGPQGETGPQGPQGAGFQTIRSDSAANTPAGVEWTKITVEGPVEIVGTLVASASTYGNIYCVLNGTSAVKDIYDEYYTVKVYSEGAGEYVYSWEKVGGSAQAPVTSVNTKVGAVVLDATDIKLTTTGTTVQANFNRIDLEVEDLIDDVADLETAVAGKQDGLPINANGHYAYSENRGEIFIDETQYATAAALEDKQDILTAGSGISIINNVISATGGSELTPEALVEVLEGSETVVVDINEAGTKVQVSLDQDVVDDIAALETGMTSLTSRVGAVEDGLEDVAEDLDALEATVAGKQNILTAGTNITIVNDVISATGGGASYTAGDGIDITNNVISVDDTIALKSEIPTKTSDLTNDSGFITSADIPACDVNSVNGQTGTVVLDASDINTEDDITIDEAISGIKTDITTLDNSKQAKITSANKLSADLVVATNAQSVQANLERIDLEVEGLVDDVADLQEGKLNASKSAVSAVGGLVIPTATPISEEIVGIDTNGDQERITIGNNLTLVDGILSATGGTSALKTIDNKSIEGSGNIVTDVTVNSTATYGYQIQIASGEYIYKYIYWNGGNNFAASDTSSVDTAWAINNRAYADFGKSFICQSNRFIQYYSNKINCRDKIYSNWENIHTAAPCKFVKADGTDVAFYRTGQEGYAQFANADISGYVKLAFTQGINTYYASSFNGSTFNTTTDINDAMDFQITSYSGYKFSKLTALATSSGLSYVLPSKLSEFTNDAGYVAGYTNVEFLNVQSSAFHAVNEPAGKHIVYDSDGLHLVSDSYISNTVTIPSNSGTIALTSDIPTKTSDLINDSGFITNSAIPTNVSAFTNDAGYLTQHQSLAAYRTSADQDIIDATKQNTLTAGANITIVDNVISAVGSGVGYAAGNGITIDENYNIIANGNFDHKSSITLSNSICNNALARGVADLTLRSYFKSDDTTGSVSVSAGRTGNAKLTIASNQGVGSAVFNCPVTATNIPAAPSSDGNYIPKCSIVNGAATYTWENGIDGNLVKLTSGGTEQTLPQALNAMVSNINSLSSSLNNKLDASKCTYQTTAPTSAISDGGVHVVYLTSEPTTKYNGYIYLIKE